jgi:hypothetical protein
MGAGESMAQCKIEPSEPPLEIRLLWMGCHASAAWGVSCHDSNSCRARTADFSLVASQSDQLLHGSNIEDLDESIPRPCGDHIAVRVPLDRLHRVLVPVSALDVSQLHKQGLPAQGGQALSTPRIPELDQVVFAARYEQALGRMPLDALDVPPVARQRPLLAHLLEAPQLHGRVVRARHEAGVVRREGDVADGFRVRLEGLQVVHVDLKVLDHAAVVA